MIYNSKYTCYLDKNTTPGIRKLLFKLKFRNEWNWLRDVLRSRNSNYNFESFRKTGSIFIHIPKSAGISISKSIYNNLGCGHLPLRYYGLFFDIDLKNYFKFTFVRNPFDRLFSAFNFLNKGGLNNRDKYLFNKYFRNCKDFRDFVLHGINNNNIYKIIHLIPQYEFISDVNGNILTDFIGRFENLRHDFEIITNKLNIEANLLNENITNKKNESFLENYDDQMYSKVYDLYIKDFQLFDYKK